MLASGLRKSFYSQQIYDEKNVKVENEESINKEESTKITNMILNIIGNNIRSIRKAQKFTISELASKAGISAKYLQGVEVGKRNISVTNLNKVAKVLDIDIVVFFRDIEPSKSKSLFLISAKLKSYNLEQLDRIESFIKNFEDVVGSVTNANTNNNSNNNT